MTTGQGGIPPRISGVRITRRRGGQPGNANRRRHGAFSRAAIAQREGISALIRAADSLIVRAHMVARARTALRRKRTYSLSASGGEGRVRGTVSPHRKLSALFLLRYALTPMLSPICVGARETVWDSARDPPWSFA
jgi:hypothetical protein